MKNVSLLNRAGIPFGMGWGYLGVLVFMMADGIEQGWLSPYLIEQGMTIQQSAILFTVYGITIAISSWFSGVLAEGFGPRKTMLMGSVLYILGTIGFVGYGINVLDYPTMLITYAVRGFGYPLFAYSFLVWITYNSPQRKWGRAVGWFWFVFTGGLNVLGAYYSTWAINSLGYIDTLWSAIFWIMVGTVFALLFTGKKVSLAIPKDRGGKMEELLKGVTIIKEEPKVLLGGIVRIINTTAQFAFPVYPAILLFSTPLQWQFLDGDGLRGCLGSIACWLCSVIGTGPLTGKERQRGGYGYIELWGRPCRVCGPLDCMGFYRHCGE
ncbi:MAG: MFS transporter [Anditalea sp.]